MLSSLVARMDTMADKPSSEPPTQLPAAGHVPGVTCEPCNSPLEYNGHGSPAAR
jgi:hypothetical protein